MKFHSITLASILQCPENEHLEFKEAKTGFDFERLVKYCAAFANENSGCLVLGVTDKIPRKIVGTQAFTDLEKIKSAVIEHLKIRVDVQEEITPQGRVLIFNVPSRPIGVPIGYKGVYWMRAGEDTVPMTSDVLKRIFNETAPDFSAETCPGLTLNDLVPEAIEKFRMLWLRKSGHKN